jgi:hypothetical protein
MMAVFLGFEFLVGSVWLCCTLFFPTLKDASPLPVGEGQGEGSKVTVSEANTLN